MATDQEQCVSAASPRHIPVMCAEVLAAMEPRSGGIYLDGTFGAGGHSRAFLEGADCTVLAIDRDPSAIAEGEFLEKLFSGRLFLVCDQYSRMSDCMARWGFAHVDGVLLDLGISSMQVDDGMRGFSFLRNGPLDMRMGKSGVSAADVVNQASERDLANIIFALGEERRAGAVARAIVRKRAGKQIESTAELADVVASVIGTCGSYKRHPATRTFQALRIYVNNELEELQKGLFAAESVLSDAGTLLVLTFHSLEDRLVKHFFAEASGRRQGVHSRHMPEKPTDVRPTFKDIFRKLGPEENELKENPRARSACLRGGTRTGEPARTWQDSEFVLSRIPPLARYHEGGAR